MNKKQAARARRRAAKQENMPTVDELMEIAKYGMTKKHAEEYEKWKAMQDTLVATNPFYGTGMASLAFHNTLESKPTSNNRPKPKDPTYDHKPRKIVLD